MIALLASEDAVSGALLPARNQMALSLGWHIILACFGMTFPILIFVLHRRGLRGDADSLELAQRWSKIAALLFAVGAVSGTILSFEMGLLWPGLMERFGDVVGLAFALEGIAFFVEAIFLGLYVYGWERIPGRLHSLLLLPITAAGIAGSFLVISVNGWMQSPTGFTLVDGPDGFEVVDIDPLAAIFNDTVFLQFLHMYLAAVMVVGFMVSAVYAGLLLRGRQGRIYRLGVLVPLLFAGIATPLQPVVGHFAGQQVASSQPIKLAALEGLNETGSRVPLELGGLYIDGELRGAVEVPIPGLLSFLSTNDINAELPGLESVPEDERPPAGIVHLAYTAMIGIGTALVGLIGWAALRWRRARNGGSDILGSRLFLRALTVAGPAAIFALEAGWVVTEVGRQPWIVYEVLRTEDAVTDANYIWVTFIAVAVVYGAMTVAVAAVIRSMSRRWAAGDTHLARVYGPSPAESLAEPEPATPAETGNASEADR